MNTLSLGFHGRTRPRSDRLPPGQYPVLSAGPTPGIPGSAWESTLTGTGGERLRTWDRAEFGDLPQEEPAVGIHCVTRWRKRTRVGAAPPSTSCRKA